MHLTISKTKRVLLVCSAVLGSCSTHVAGGPSRVAATPAEEPVAPAEISLEPATAQGAGALSRAEGADYLGVVDRAGLTAIVEQGLGRMLGRLQLRPTLEGNRFRGFRVAGLDAQWSTSGVRTGDIITRLNGQPIERPEQAMVAFDSLRVASEIAVEIVRDSKPMRLRYRVE